MKKVYIIWIWWIWVSGIARYYLHKWIKVYGSDSTNSQLIKKLINEWCDIFIWERPELITDDINLVIYTEAIPSNHPELKKAIDLNIKTQTYPESLAEIANWKKLITIAWTHGKSTTASMISLVLKNSNFSVNAVVWTILKEFGWKNTYFSESDYFVIEACEYKRSFLKYKPYIWIITNIELDHLDYYKNLSDYISAFEEYLQNIKTNWYAIINWNCKNSMSLFKKRDDINYILIYDDYFELHKIWKRKKIIKFPSLDMKVPWPHILFDAYISYSVWYILWLENNEIKKSLEWYNWVWRRSEIVWNTKNNNIIISDYWHHPTEIKLTLKSLKEKYYDKKLIVIFQPHQYNRTIELLEDFINSFNSADTLIITNIYKSRDSKEDMEKINGEIFTKKINHPNKIYWEWLKETLNIINKFDKESNDLVIVLLWAWDIDNLRFDLKK